MSVRQLNVIDISEKDYLFNARIKVGLAIREFREKRGYSQCQLAEIMDISRSTISKIENGKFSFSIDYLSKFSYFLDFELCIDDKNKKILK